VAIAGPPREQVVGKPVSSVFQLIRTFVMHKPFQDFCLQVEEELSTLTEATEATRWTPEQWQRAGSRFAGVRKPLQRGRLKKIGADRQLMTAETR
jgi:hypothetical protein